MSSSSSKVTLLLLLAFFSAAIAIELTIDSAGDQYCSDLMFRGGCAQCEASPDCSFCAPYDDTYAGACRANDSTLNCDALVSSHGYIAAEEANLCPNPNVAGVRQAGIRKADFDPNSLADVKNSYRYTTFNDGFYCDIGLARPYDRFSVKSLHTVNPASNDDLCNVVNNQFGFSFESCECCCCDNEYNAHQSVLLVARKPITNAEELVAEVMSNCADQQDKRLIGVMNPYSSEQTLECIRLMQEAYCSFGCPAYDMEQGKICRTGTEIDELFRLCSPYTNGPDGEARENCPLDPNSLPLAEVDGEDSFAPTFCDGNLKAIEETSRFSNDFKMFEGVVPQAADDEGEFNNCGDVCSNLCAGNVCDNIGGGQCPEPPSPSTPTPPTPTPTPTPTPILPTTLPPLDAN